ncbi:MAG: hypothetical protein KIT73_12680 [Burkholderiales bacterium]|nr:hypothetical protein [Burkholderiales bacterium]
MRFFDTKQLVIDFSESRVTEKSSAEYYLGNTLLLVLLTYYEHLFGLSNSGLLFFVECGVVLVVSILGVATCFRANGGADGRDFMLRANCLAFPIALKLNVANMMLGWLVYAYFPEVIDYRSFRSPALLDALLTFVWAPAFTALFFWRLAVHLRTIANSSTGSEQRDVPIPASS